MEIFANGLMQKIRCAAGSGWNFTGIMQGSTTALAKLIDLENIAHAAANGFQTGGIDQVRYQTVEVRRGWRLRRRLGQTQSGHGEFIRRDEVRSFEAFLRRGGNVIGGGVSLVANHSG